MLSAHMASRQHCDPDTACNANSIVRYKKAGLPMNDLSVPYMLTTYEKWTSKPSRPIADVSLPRVKTTAVRSAAAAVVTLDQEDLLCMKTFQFCAPESSYSLPQSKRTWAFTGVALECI